MPLYFIAIVAPDPINKEVAVFKNFMFENYGCKVALRSPAHITLVPPFNMNTEREAEMLRCITHFWSGRQPFEIQLTNFAAFKPRVIYVDVIMSEALEELKNELEEFLSDRGFPIKKETRPFHPHVTIANRDLERSDFLHAWQHFRESRYDATFEVSGIDLLRSERDGWAIVPRFRPQSPSSE